MWSSLLILAAVVACAWGHGRVLEPPSRASAWRFGYPVPADYDDDGANCGGFSAQHTTNGGKCGICGDAYNIPPPRPHELGGMYGIGVITGRYQPGGTITTTVDLTTSHRGFWEFKLCPDPTSTDQACFDRYVLEHEEGGTKYYPNRGSSKYNVTYKIPANLACDHCVLQWRYTAGNNWGICANGSSGLGCGAQEQFGACSDISIGAGNKFALRDGAGIEAPLVYFKNGYYDVQQGILHLLRGNSRPDSAKGKHVLNQPLSTQRPNLPNPPTSQNNQRPQANPAQDTQPNGHPNSKPGNPGQPKIITKTTTQHFIQPYQQKPAPNKQNIQHANGIPTQQRPSLPNPPTSQNNQRPQANPAQDTQPNSQPNSKPTQQNPGQPKIITKTTTQHFIQPYQQKPAPNNQNISHANAIPTQQKQKTQGQKQRNHSKTHSQIKHQQSPNLIPTNQRPISPQTPKQLQQIQQLQHIQYLIQSGKQINPQNTQKRLTPKQHEQLNQKLIQQTQSQYYYNRDRQKQYFQNTARQRRPRGPTKPWKSDKHGKHRKGKHNGKRKRKKKTVYDEYHRVITVGTW